MRVTRIAEAAISAAIEPNCGIWRHSGHSADAPEESWPSAVSGVHVSNNLICIVTGCRKYVRYVTFCGSLPSGLIVSTSRYAGAACMTCMTILSGLRYSIDVTITLNIFPQIATSSVERPKESGSSTLAPVAAVSSSAEVKANASTRHMRIPPYDDSACTCDWCSWFMVEYLRTCLETFNKQT